MPASVLARNQRDALFPIAVQMGVNVRETGGKVVVRDVLPESPATKAGLKPGMTISKVAGETVRSAEQFYRKVVEAGLFRGTEVELSIEENDITRDVKIKIGD
jgi:S1-C subfamily serine protease